MGALAPWVVLSAMSPAASRWPTGCLPTENDRAAGPVPDEDQQQEDVMYP